MRAPLSRCLLLMVLAALSALPVQDAKASPLAVSVESGVLEGRVLDGQGHPVSDVMIRAEGRMTDRTSFGITRTDDEGHYQIGGLEPGLHVVTVMPRENGARTQAEVEIRAGANRLDLSLAAGVEISGRVVDARGAPVEDATVWLRGLQENGSWGLQTLSAVDGSFHFQVPDGEYRLMGEHRGFSRSKLTDAFRVAGSPVQGLEIRLSPGAVIRGQILGLAPGDRQRITVLAEDKLGSTVPGEVGAEGTYRIPDVPPGEWTVRAELPSDVVAQGQLEIGKGDEEIVLNLQLPTGFALSGRVALDDSPLPGAVVIVHSAAVENRMEAHTQTASDGRFRFERLPPATYTLIVMLPSGDPDSRTIEIDGDREIAIEIGGADSCRTHASEGRG